MLHRHVTAAALAAVLLLAGAACRRHVAPVKEVSVPDAAAALQSQALFVDVNTEDYRRTHGKVPGALLLEGYRTYDPAAVLPPEKDRRIVFYCASRL